MTLEYSAARPITRRTPVPVARAATARQPVRTNEETAMHRFIPLAALVLAGCSAFRLPSEPLAVTSDFQPPFDGVVAAVALGAAVYYVIDPKAPNWEVRTTQLDPKRVEIALRMKRFSTGGEGEALALVRRHASEIAAKAGAGGYELQSYTQGIDSETLGARRNALGVIRLLPPA
jgi:hypothetical protein